MSDDVSPLLLQFPNLTEENAILYAAKAYVAPNLIVSEFEEDLQRVVYVKRLINKYRVLGILKERLILNHIIILYNVFGLEAATRLLFLRLDEIDYTIIKPFLVLINVLPKTVRGVNNRDIDTDVITLKQEVVDQLRKTVGS